MFPKIVPAVVTSIALASMAAASPVVSRQSGDTGDNGSCAQMYHQCSLRVDQGVTDPWSFKECLFGAACFGGHRPVDDFLASIYDTVNNGTSTAPPTSVNEPRVSSSVFQSIATDGKLITQQNWIDVYYSTLDATNGPYPTSSAPVIDYYNRIAEWTGFCSGGVPEQNFQDYYQYSASVSSSGCSQTKRSGASTNVSSDATCQKMFDTCVNEVYFLALDVFQHKSCLLGASCFGGQRPVAGFIDAVYTALENTGPAPTPVKEGRISRTVFDTISTDNATISQQNFIDGWYSELTTVGGPYPPNSDLVIGYFQRIAEWTGYCRSNIPYGNTSDYFQYSSTVQGASCSF